MQHGHSQPPAANPWCWGRGASVRGATHTRRHHADIDRRTVATRQQAQVCVMTPWALPHHHTLQALCEVGGALHGARYQPVAPCGAITKHVCGLYGDVVRCVGWQCRCGTARIEKETVRPRHRRSPAGRDRASQPRHQHHGSEPSRRGALVAKRSPVTAGPAVTLNNQYREGPARPRRYTAALVQLYSTKYSVKYSRKVYSCQM